LMERVGLGERTIEHFEENSKELTAKGLNVPFWLSLLRAVVDAVKAADERQERLKAETKAATASLNAADDEGYRIVSGAIDAAVAAWGKGSERGEILARMRSKLHRRDSDEGVPTVVERPA